MKTRVFLAPIVVAMSFAAFVATPAIASEILDWNRIDWRLDRALLVSRYLFHDRQPADPWAEYLKTLAEGVSPTADDIEPFLALPEHRRAERSHRSYELLESARIAVADYATDLRDQVQANDVNYIGDLMWETPGFGEAITSALGRLEFALDHDPLNVEAWYHLAYFSGIVGDQLRATRAHEGFFAAWEHLAESDRTESLLFYREQAILDHAWDLREAGEYDRCLAWLAGHDGELAHNAEPPVLAPYLESLLIRALVHAERGETGPARNIVQHLPLMDLPSRSAAPNQTYVTQFNQRMEYYRRMRSAGVTQPGSDWMGRDTGTQSNSNSPIHLSNEKWQDTVSDNLAREHRSSSYLRKWVKAWLSLRRGLDEETIRRDLGRIELELEFQPRLAARWWQDQGLIYEQLGEYDLAQVCWARGAVYRPLFIYAPLGQGHGIARVHGLTGTGQPYFLTYGTFFTAGSLWSYAANAGLASQVEDGAREQAMLRDNAMAHLDACIRRGFFVPQAQAMRGRMSFLAADYAAAEIDLEAAWQSLESDATAPADIALMLGLCHFNRDAWLAARPWLQAFVLRDPDAHVGWQALGMTQAFLKEPELALESLDRAVALAPDNPTYLYNRGLLRYRSGLRDGAESDFLRAQELWPENPQIAQMAQVVTDPVQYDLQMAASPVHMDLPEEQRRSLAEQMAARLGGSPAGDLSDLLVMDPESRERVLADLQKRYDEDPDPLNRLKLAQGAMLVGRPAMARDTLAPYWPGRLTPAERRLLLHADRETGEASRATEVAAGLDWPGSGEDVDLLTVAAAILMDHDRRDLARRVVDRALDLQPGNQVLQDLHRNLVGTP